MYLFNTFPNLIMQGTGPYWFHLVSYKARVRLCFVLFASSLVVVARGTSLYAQLFGIAMGSIAGGLGESSILALCSFYDEKAISAWSG